MDLSLKTALSPGKLRPPFLFAGGSTTVKATSLHVIPGSRLLEIN